MDSATRVSNAESSVTYVQNEHVKWNKFSSDDYWSHNYNVLQAEDRVHRIGQPNAVNIHYLLGRHSLDDLLWPMLVKKSGHRCHTHTLLAPPRCACCDD